MTHSKALARRVFLGSTAATVLGSFAGCGEDEHHPVDSRSQADASSDGSSPAAVSVDAGGPDVGGPDVGGPDARGSDARGSDAGGSDAGGSVTASGDAGNLDAGSSIDGSVDAESTAAPGETSQHNTQSDTSTANEPSTADSCYEGGGTDGGGLGGDAATGGLCSTNTYNGNHCHPLRVPSSDVYANLAEMTYMLEDGGTGHTHAVRLTAYDFLYLQAGVSRQLRSTVDDDHDHVCVISYAV
jgi:hypothetical protein